MVNIAVVSTSIVLSVAITVLNSGCLFVLLSRKRQRPASSLLLASLLIIHIIQGIIVIPFYTVKRWNIEGEPVCSIFRFTYLLTNYLSCITILLISLDRFVAIRFPLHYRVRAINSCVLKVMAGSWVYVLALCLIPFWNSDDECIYNPSKIWSVVMLSWNTFTPFLIIIFIYTYISRKSFVFVRNCERRRCRQKGERPQQRKRRSVVSMKAFLSKEFGAAKVAILITVSYIVCWGPSFMYYMLKNTCEHCFSKSFKNSSTEDNLNYAMKILTLIDGLAAPTIYCLRNMDVVNRGRKSFRSFTESVSRNLTSRRTVVTLESTTSQIDTQMSWNKEEIIENRALSPIPDTENVINGLDRGGACDATEEKHMMMNSEKHAFQKIDLSYVLLIEQQLPSQGRARISGNENEALLRSPHDSTNDKQPYESIDEVERCTDNVVQENMIVAVSRRDSTLKGSKDSRNFTDSLKNMGRQVEIESSPGDTQPLLTTSDQSSSSDQSSDSKEETTFIS